MRTHLNIIINLYYCYLLMIEETTKKSEKNISAAYEIVYQMRRREYTFPRCILLFLCFIVLNL